MLRRFLLALTFVGIVGVLSAQSIRFEHNGTVYEEGQTLIAPFVDFEYLQEMEIRNLTGNDLNIIVEQEVVNNVEGAMVYFCWGKCFVPSVSVSEPVPVLANSLSDKPLSFHAINDDLEGVVSAIYYAYPENDPENRISITILSGACANTTENTLDMGHVYPNPASSLIHVDFRCDNVKGASVVVYNLLGQEVKSQKINGTQGRVNIAVDDLQPGIYFCSLRADNAVAQTEKFIVKR